MTLAREAHPLEPAIRRSASRPRGPGLRRAAFAAVLSLAGVAATGTASPADFPRALSGRWIAAAPPEGGIVLFDLAAETRREWAAPGEPVLALSFDPASAETPAADPAAPPPILLVATRVPGGSEIHRLEGERGESTGRIRLSGEVAFLLAARGAGSGHAIVTRANAGDEPRRRGDATGIVAFEFGRDGTSGTIPFEGLPLAAALCEGGDRILVAQPDKVRSFLTSPLRSSWMLRSPGENVAILPLSGRGALLAARGRDIVRLDPENLPPRDPNTGAISEDDAISRVELPFEAASLALSGDGALGVAFDGPGRRLAALDLASGQVLGEREIPETLAGAFHPRRESVVLLTAQATIVEMPLLGRAVAAPAPPPGHPGAAGADLPAAPPAAAPAAPGAIALAPRGSAAPEAVGTSPAIGAEAPAAGSVGRPEADPVPAGPAGGASPGGVATEVAAPPAPAREIAPPPAAAGTPAPAPLLPTPGRAEGRISGDAALVEAIVFYGPDAILKEHARAAPGPEGRFSLPLPPPGRYRIVPLGAGGVALICRPSLRTILVGTDAIAGLDFEIGGLIPGSLKPAPLP